MEKKDFAFGRMNFILLAVGMAVVIFLLLLFLTLVSDGIGYIISMYKEINFRLN